VQEHGEILVRHIHIAVAADCLVFLGGTAAAAERLSYLNNKGIGRARKKA
jgi:hypothetical protein